MSESGPFGRRGDEPPREAPAPQEPARARPAPPPPPRPPARASSFTWLLGVVCVLALAYISLNTLRTDAPGSRGVPTGKPPPPFAVPLASSTRSCGGDGCNANVARRPGDGARTPACQVRGSDVLNGCPLADRGPAALAFVATRSTRCEDQVDVMQRLRARFGNVAFAAVAVRGDQDKLRDIIRQRGWTLPVGFDRDGAVSNLYAVAVCPTITFLRQGGVVDSTSLTFLDDAALAAKLRAIGGRAR